MKLVPLKTYINGYLTTFYNLDNSEHFRKIQDWNDSNHDYYIYLWIYLPTNTCYYIGKGLLKYSRWKDSRCFLHKKDMLSRTINPKDWCCKIIFSGLTENQAYAAEAYLISICKKNRSHKGQWTWDEESLINKRREWKHEELIEKYLILDGNNYWETLRREINDYKRPRISFYSRICRTLFSINV